ncbi:MAG: hypothetical protein JWR24_238 [Actinoallomurus sp.]|nr:hypothetical protein [Actinoallomurus sp.]
MTGPGGVLVLVGIAAVSALADGLTEGGPGLILDVGLVLGAVVAAMSTSARAMWLIIPMPPLVFSVMAVAAGVVGDQNTSRSLTRLATAAATWITKGFVAMVAATLLGVMVIVVRAANRRF